MLIPDVTDELSAYHFKTQLHTDQSDFFEFLKHRNCKSMEAMIENIEQFQKKKNTSYGKRSRVQRTSVGN